MNGRKSMAVPLNPSYTKPLILWKPNAGPQEALINCPIEDALFGGARGGGKTDAMLGDWILHAFRCGSAAKGVFFRRTLPQLEEVIERAKRLFAGFGKYKDMRKTFEFSNGALLKFRYLDNARDADNYQGHEYTRIYFEECTNWADPKPIDLLKATLRSPSGIACRMRLTGNPGGVGHQWVKARYIDVAPPMTVITDPESQMRRVFIPSKLLDNPYLGDDYVAKLKSIGTAEIVRAWLDGDWSIIAGAFLGSLWRSSVHEVAPFNIPRHWQRWRSMDWGYAKPFSVQWFAKADNGDVFVYRELYGIERDRNGMIKPNHGSRQTAEIVAGLVKAAEKAELEAGIEIRGNPADPAIWSNTGTELSIEEHFRKSGVLWQKADNAAGSRKQGAQEVIRRLQLSAEGKDGGLYFFRHCTHSIRTISAIPTSQHDPEDVDSNAEDHAWDCLRYGLRRRKPETKKAEAFNVDQFEWMRRMG